MEEIQNLETEKHAEAVKKEKGKIEELNITVDKLKKVSVVGYIHDYKKQLKLRWKKCWNLSIIILIIWCSRI